eukprot:c26750_g1_i1.p1 GENE.c26750_g1_i1~~c26750_g1_i1.p1  ORF type:complete len:248 (+),score=53.85 c26750_g1_i1:61-744(+)
MAAETPAAAPTDYAALLGESFASVKQLLSVAPEAAGFTPLKKDGEITISKIDAYNGGALTLVRADTEFKTVSAEKYIHFLNDNAQREQCDGVKAGGKLMSSTVAAELEDGKIQIIRRAFAMPAMVTNRDVVIAHRFYEEEVDGKKVTWSVSKSCEHPAAPLEKKFERMNIHVLGFRIQANEAGTGTLVSYVNLTDPSGWLPSALVNSQIASGPLFLRTHETFVAALP